MTIGLPSDEAVGVEADPDALRGIGLCRRLEAGSAHRERGTHRHEIGRVGQLAVGRVAGDHPHRHPGSGKGSAIVGDRPAPGVRLLDCRPQGTEARGLGRLRGRDLVALDRGDDALVPYPLEGVDDRDDGDDRSVERRRRIGDARDELWRNGGTRSVVDEHEGVVRQAGRAQRG